MALSQADILPDKTKLDRHFLNFENSNCFILKLSQVERMLQVIQPLGKGHDLKKDEIERIELYLDDGLLLVKLYDGFIVQIAAAGKMEAVIYDGNDEN